MKRNARQWLVPALLLLAVANIPAVSAFSLSEVSISPPGYQPAGTAVNVSFSIDMASLANETIPQDSELQMRTDLIHATWTSVLVVDGVVTRLPPQAGNSVVIPGWYISFPSHQSVQVRGTVSGTIPANPSPAKDFLNIRDVDRDTRIVSTARVGMADAPDLSSLAPAETPLTKKPVTRPPFTPIPTDTPSQDPPLGIAAGVLAAAGAAFLAVNRR